jgi:GAF domain-containing protein
LRNADDRLKFAIMQTESLHLALGGSTGRSIPYEPIPMFDPSTGDPNHRHIASYAALSGRTVNFADAYAMPGFDFSGTRAFDRQTGYRSTSLLTIPLKDGQERVIGVLQLLNAQDPGGGIIAFEPAQQRVVEALAAVAGVALQAYLREQALRQEIQQLRIEIDETRTAREAAEITTSESFQRLQQRAGARRGRQAAPGGA